MTRDDRRFFEAFREYMGQYPLTDEQFSRFVEGYTEAVPSETITALYDALDMWSAAITGANK